MIYKILQLKNRRDCDYAWMSYEYAEKHNFNITDYEVVYKGQIQNINSNEDILEELFFIFNCKHPEDFKGHSLSVSDIIILDDDIYYVDSFGFRKIEEYDSSKILHKFYKKYPQYKNYLVQINNDYTVDVLYNDGTYLGTFNIIEGDN